MKRGFDLLTLLIIGCLAGVNQGSGATQPEVPLSLAGTWRFRLDAADAGVREQWHRQALPEKIRLPGSLPAQGIGDEVTVNTKWTGGIVDKSWFTAPEYEKYRQPGNVKVPFWLQPDKYYVGPAWYQRDIELPEAWKGRRIVLTLERPHWETRVWVDDKPMGTNLSLSTAHDYDLGTSLAPGKHRLTIRVDNRLVVDVGHDSHSVSDHTQGNWNGIVGRIELRATAPVWVDDLQAHPRLAAKGIAIKGRLGNATGKAGSGKLKVTAAPLNAPGVAEKQVEVKWDANGGAFEFELPLPTPLQLWDEFRPSLYRLEASLDDQPAEATTFGLRELTAQGTQIAINGRKTFMRGTLECAIFPKTGHPPVDVETWGRVIRTAKAHGLNNIRFHSWCPPEAAFVAADELGFYLHVEASSWANSSTTLGDGKPVDQWLYDETDRILRHYGNHPSFVLMLYGNEPGGPKHGAWLAQWVNHYKSRDPRRLFSSGAGWPQIPENQLHVTPDPRIQAWGGGLKSRINALPPETRTDYREYVSARSVPVISHEIGQWCVYPNFDETRKYTGYLKAKNFEIFRDTLEAHHLGHQARAFLHASGKLQTLCYKEDIESALRTPGMGGFQLLDLHDFPGQGTALVGVLDPFWEGKGYVTAAEYSRFCNSVVPLARLAKRVFTTNEKLEADLEVANYGPAAMSPALTTWKLVGDDGKVVASGIPPLTRADVGGARPLTSISLDLSQVPAPARYKLVVSVRAGSETADSEPASPPFENDWDVWVYPANVDTEPPPGIAVVSELDDKTLGWLERGGKVLLTLPAKSVKNAATNRVALGFSSIFWNTAWTRRQAPTTLGILCDPKHPALADFPTDTHSNWQWWYLISRAGALMLDDLPRSLSPTVQVIDDWFTARKLGLVIEGRVGKGSLLATSIDLRDVPPDNAVARQMLHSLFRYMDSRQFKPSVKLTPGQVRGLYTGSGAVRNQAIRRVKASSAEATFEAENAFDGDPATLWHTAWTGGVASFPHELQIELKEVVALRGFAVLPRQDGNPNGWIKDYALHLSPDGMTWGEAVARGTFPRDSKRHAIEFQTPKTARHIRLVALSGHANGPWASVAELELLPAAK